MAHQDWEQSHIPRHRRNLIPWKTFLEDFECQVLKLVSIIGDLKNAMFFENLLLVSDDSNDMNFDYQTTPRKGGNINPDPIVWKAPKTPPRRTDIKIGTPNSVSLMVFLGGIPWDIDEKALAATFRQFGKIHKNIFNQNYHM